MDRVPTGSELVVRVATPLVVVPVPIEVVPFKKVTCSPFGIAFVAVTVAVNVTELLMIATELEDFTVVFVARRVTCSLKAGEVEVRKPVPPE